MTSLLVARNDFTATKIEAKGLLGPVAAFTVNEPFQRTVEKDSTGSVEYLTVFIGYVCTEAVFITKKLCFQTKTDTSGRGLYKKKKHFFLFLSCGRFCPLFGSVVILPVFVCVGGGRCFASCQSIVRTTFSF